MKQETKETIELAKSITSGIIELYEELAKLEANNLETTEEYFQTLVKLNTSIKLEYEIISRIFKNTKETTKALKYLQEISEEEIKCISIANKEELINHRILEIIRNYALSNPQKIAELQLIESIKSSEISIEDFNELIDEDDIKVIEEAIKEKNASYICAKSIQFDMNILFIIILNKKIKSEHNKRIRKELIIAKYLKIGITPLIEETILNQAFRIPLELYQSIHTLPIMYGFDPKILESIINETKQKSYNNQINWLIPDNATSYVSKSELELNLREIKIRIALSYFSEEEVIEVNEEFHEYLDKLEGTVFESFFEDTAKTVTKAFKAFNKDKTLIKKVTIGK